MQCVHIVILYRSVQTHKQTLTRKKPMIIILDTIFLQGFGLLHIISDDGGIHIGKQYTRRQRRSSTKKVIRYSKFVSLFHSEILDMTNDCVSSQSELTNFLSSMVIKLYKPTMKKCISCEKCFCFSEFITPLFEGDTDICKGCHDFHNDVHKSFIPSMIDQMKEQASILEDIAAAGQVLCRIGNEYNKTEAVIMLPCKVVKDEFIGSIIEIPFPENHAAIDTSNSMNFVCLADDYHVHVPYRTC